MRHKFNCDECGEDKVHDSTISTGYGTDADGRKICFDCCAENDRQSMIDNGHSKCLPLYLSNREGKCELTNWPGTLRFSIRAHRRNGHNIAGFRTDVWFAGPDGHIWHGVQYGGFTQICHCRRTKQMAEAS